MEWIFKIGRSLVLFDLSCFCKHFVTKLHKKIISAINGVGPAFNLYTSLPISIGGSGHGGSLIGLLLTVSLFDSIGNFLIGILFASCCWCSVNLSFWLGLGGYLQIVLLYTVVVPVFWNVLPPEIWEKYNIVLSFKCMMKSDILSGIISIWTLNNHIPLFISSFSYIFD